MTPEEFIQKWLPDYKARLEKYLLNREDIDKYYIPATAIAYKHNMPKLANVIMLGHLLAATDIFTVDELVMSMEKSISSSKKDLLAANINALNLGFEYVEV